MSKPLVFMMGRSPVFLPTDRRYAQNHMWAQAMEDGYRLGFSAYAVKLLGDLGHLEWAVTPGTSVAPGQQIGFIEGSKATSDLYSPASGRIERVNEAVLADPSLINTSLYDDGWLLVMAGRGDGFLSPEQYLAHLDACWPLTQRMLKAQARGNDER
jgi:glycine cleavage system H protein